ncbi:hypothetical protein [Paenibacillus montanisoli]|uniref:Uncharacterized protein n=1 Tax=Paenibacillus montanisoli TaxID=2081970 RepID=A0A328U7J1_9BACL|nr:hypothetical protein [Paenibacillus montanisoli]RAP78052.1 hypothetical protein DL346_06305 [Paenibacillus montanisoli]
MSEYKEFLEEKAAIDGYLEQGYRIVNVIEDLSGDQLQLAPPEADGYPVTLHLRNANARKYWTSRLLANG